MLNLKVAIIGSNMPLDYAEECLLANLPQSTTTLLFSAGDPLAGVAENIAHTLRLCTNPTKGNLIDMADEVLIFWDGTDSRTNRLAADCVKRGKPVRLLPMK